ncbi:hypothetical protein STENM327S_00305 [Streptomyces tendae]
MDARSTDTSRQRGSSVLPAAEGGTALGRISLLALPTCILVPLVAAGIYVELPRPPDTSTVHDLTRALTDQLRPGT